MEKSILFLFFTLMMAHFNINAQAELWATSDAEWYYSETDQIWFFGYSHYKIERDTFLLGKNCQIYSKSYKTHFTGLPYDTVYQDVEDIYFIIGLEDSVLYSYSFSRNVFDTIINFKGNIGDTWKTYYRDTNCIPNDGPTYFETKILTKETEIVNGLSLLKFTLERNVIEYDMISTDVFYQLIGGANGNFVYNKLCFASDYSEETDLRCFSYHIGQADEFNYKVMQDCDNIPTLDLKGESKLNKIIVVNPVLDNIIRLKNIETTSLTGIRLYNNLGKELRVKTYTEQNTYIITPKVLLHTGVYFCLIEFKDGWKQTLKIIIQN